MDLPPRCRLHTLHTIGDERGSLIALEGGKTVPFEIARIYYIFDTKSDVSRGFHAHRELRQWAVSVGGACTIILDDGRAKCEVRLDKPNVALEIGPFVWHEMYDFSPGCVLLLIASDHYDEADYIRDYGEFRALVRGAEA